VEEFDRKLKTLTIHSIQIEAPDQCPMRHICNISNTLQKTEQLKHQHPA
jgi:hypothetical protein